MMAFGRSPEAALSQRRAGFEKHLLLTRAETMGGAGGASENRLKGEETAVQQHLGKRGEKV